MFQSKAGGQAWNRSKKGSSEAERQSERQGETEIEKDN